MEALWHSIVNVAIVIGSIMLAVVLASEAKQVLASVLLFLAGVGIYVVEASYGVTEGLCTLDAGGGFLHLLVRADQCFDSYSFAVSVAQVSIIAALLLWLAMAWRAVFRKFEAEQGKKEG